MTTCGCEIELPHMVDLGKQPIRYCPLHAQAPAMVEHVRRVSAMPHGASCRSMKVRRHATLGECDCGVNDARAILRAIEEG